MAINSEVIIWTCVTVAVLVGICAIVLIAMSSRNMKKNRESWSTHHVRGWYLRKDR